MYDELLSRIQNHFARAVSQTKALFTTDVEGLWELYIDNLPEEDRQHHTCNTCKSFINRYGGDAEGVTALTVLRVTTTLGTQDYMIERLSWD